MALAPSSPRLPSPPPPAEIQIAPNSPSGGPAASLQATHMEQMLLDSNSKRRIHPGTKSQDMAVGPPLIPLNELDSPFQLQEHLAALHYHHSANGTRPVDRDTAILLAQFPPGIDRTLWLYELCRFLISQCNSLIVGFLFDTPACSATTCPEMRASEWQFLCAVHEQPKSCCAIDYCCHTLDWAANVVTDQKLFPSRFVAPGGGAGGDAHGRNIGVKNLVNVFRRLHRIFAHAWFQHRSVFWSVEGQTGLYVFFKTVCDMYDLLPAENYKLPPEAEGLETSPSEPEPEKPTPIILKNASQRDSTGTIISSSSDENLQLPGRTNTRRHIRSSPSTGSAVTTVIEAEEEETDGVTARVRDLRISAPESVSEEPETADVPMMVEEDGPAAAASTATVESSSAPEKVEEEADAGDQTVIEDASSPQEEPETPVARTEEANLGNTETTLAAGEDETKTINDTTEDVDTTTSTPAEKEGEAKTVSEDK